MTKDLALTYCALIALLALTFGASFLPLGIFFGTALGLAVAVSKSFLIIKIFMEYGQAGKTSNVFFKVGLGWLAILCFILLDYTARSWDTLPRNWNPNKGERMIGSEEGGAAATPLEIK